MYIEKEFDDLILFTQPIIFTLAKINDGAEIIISADRYLLTGYLRNHQYTEGVRLSDKGNLKLLEIYGLVKESLLNFMNLHNGKFSLDMFIEELCLQESVNSKFWLDFFLRKLKNDGLITDYKYRDHDMCYCFFG